MNRPIIIFKCFLLISLMSAAGGSFNTRIDASAFETRCGWFENPTPANAWLTDRDGEWLISVQGSYQADGDWPVFKESQWKKTNVHYGHGCACMKLTVDKVEKRVIAIQSSYARPLSACRKDKGLKNKEPS